MEYIKHPTTIQPLDLPAGDAVQMMVALARKSGYVSGNQCSEEFIHKLRLVVDAFGKALQESEQSVTFREAAEFSLLARSHRRPSTLADLRSYINRMCSDAEFADKSLRCISIPECRFMLQLKFGHSVHSYRKAQSILNSIFNFGKRQRWCDYNPVAAILRPPVAEHRIEILTLPQISRLLVACREREALNLMEAPFRLMLWCGIRPTEVRRLRWSDIDTGEKVVYVDSDASKTGGARAVPLRGGALSLALMKPADEKALIAPLNWCRLWRDLRNTAGLRLWQNDALRHTFASMHLKRFHNLPLLQEEMGHRNSALLQTRYLNLRNLKKSVASRFFSQNFWI